MKKFAILALAVLVAMPASAAGVTISGYLDLGFMAAQPATSANGQQQNQAVGSTNGQWNANDQFNLNELNLDLASQLTNDISMFTSLDFTGNAVSIDYAYVDFANPGPFDLNVRVGRIPSVVGIEQRASESNQTKFVNLSLLSPYTVGAIEGAAIYGSFSPVNYAVALSNSDVVDNTGGVPVLGNIMVPSNNVNGAANAASNNEDNNKFAVSGRLGVVPIEGLEIGVSGSVDQMSSTLANSKPLERTLLGIDASYAWGAFTLKGEYVTVDEDRNAGGAARKVRGYYVEGVYDVNSKWSVGARYGEVKDELSGSANPTFNVNTLSVAGVYRIADNVQLKAEYDINGEKTLGGVSVGNAATPKVKNNVLALSLVASF